jgi:hypothetical protein
MTNDIIIDYKRLKIHYWWLHNPFTTWLLAMEPIKKKTWKGPNKIIF